MNNYHYTKAIHLPSIINEGLIRTTLITNSKKERRAAWLTKSEEWEVCCSASSINPSNGPSMRLNNEEMRDMFGMCRIKISDSLPTISWQKFKYVGKVSEMDYECFTYYTESVGGKPYKWNCSFAPIPEKYFESIEMLVGDEWMVWDKSVSIEVFVDLCHSCNAEASVPEVQPCTMEVLSQFSFLQNNEAEIIEEWEKHRGVKGYLEILVGEDYNSFSSIFRTKGFKQSSFPKSVDKEGFVYLYLNILWSASQTMYKAALAYNPIDNCFVFSDYSKAA